MKITITTTMLMMACALFSCQKDVNPQPQIQAVLSAASFKNSTKPPVTPTSPPATVIPKTDTMRSKLPIGQIVTVGTWKVTSYAEGTSNVTDKFAAYTFTFDKSGTITANDNGKLAYGTWAYLNAVFYYGVPIYGSNPDGFNVYFGKVKPLGLLSKNLFISKKTTTNIYVDSVNPAENAHVTLTKIAN